MPKKLLFVFVVIFTLAFGYVQEQIKVGTNFMIDMSAYVEDYDNLPPEQRAAIIDKWRFNAPGNYYYTHEPNRWMYEFSRSQLNAMKWTAAIAFVVIHWVVTVFLLGIAFNSQSLKKLVHWGYAGLLIVSLGIFAFGKLTGWAVMYAVSREVLGALQSLFPLMLIGLAHYFYSKMKSSPQ
jgi:hypothetical protein